MNEVLLIALATLVALALPLWMKYKSQILNRFSEKLDDLEEVIEETTGIDVELSEVVEEVLEDAVEDVERLAEDFAEDGELEKGRLDSVIEEVKDDIQEATDDLVDDIVEDLNENLEETLGNMTVSALRGMLKERSLPVSGRKAELIQRLLE